MLEAVCYDARARRAEVHAPDGLSCSCPPQKKSGPGPDFSAGRNPLIPYGLSSLSSSDLPIACVRLTTFSLRRIFCTWFFTVSGLILRMAPIS
jgi:hypothetical protein